MLSSLLATVPDWFRRVADLLQVDAPVLAHNLMQVAVIWVLCWVALRLVGVVARRIEMAVDDGDDTTLTLREQRGRTISQLLRSVGKVSVLAVGLMLTLNVFIDIGPILGAAGILGLAVSFGAQSLVKDVISGFFFLLEAQFSVGDIIEAAGHSGVVERMTMRMVVLRDLEGVVHMIPNGQISTVSNKTRGWSRSVVDVGVAYGADLTHAMDVVLDEAQRLAADPAWAPKFDGEPELAGVQALDESQVTLRVLLRTKPSHQWAVGREYRRRVKNRLDREGIEIPFPQRTVYIRPVAGADAPATDAS